VVWTGFFLNQWG